jgi:CRISPR/Cas system-associated exonuclease Cas4 (RecB family)
MQIAKDNEDIVLEKLMAAGKCSKTGKKGIMSDIELLGTLSELTGYDIRFVHGEIDNIRTIRKHTERAEEHIFGRHSKAIYKEFVQLPTYEAVMGAFGDEEQEHVYKDKKIAVIGIDLFDDLDKHFIPFNFKFDIVELFKDDGRYDIDTVYAVGNDRQVAEHAVDLITNEIAEDVAIVLDTGGAIADAVRSALYRKGIAFRNAFPARDLAVIRDYMEFIRRSLSRNILTVGDVRELYSVYGGRTNPKYDRYLLEKHAKIAGGDFERLFNVMEKIETYTFSELCDTIVKKETHRFTVKMIIDELKLSDVKISEVSEGTATYLINSMSGIKHNAEIPDNEKRGVLLADCKNSVFIDRPFVIYLNMDNGWTVPVTGKKYVSSEEETKNAQKFRVLLQQGSFRIYITNTMKNGKVARPCILFDRICSEDDGVTNEINSFEKLNTTIRKGTWVRSEHKEQKKHVPVCVPRETGKLSKSSMNAYIMCPRGYLFGRLVGEPEREQNVFGNIMHEFTEFCFCYPDTAKERMDECVEKISNIYAGISCPERRDLDISKIRLSLTNIIKFVDKLNEKIPLNKKADGNNIFFKEFGLEMTSDLIETERTGDTLYGKFDLLINNKIIDHKTGRPKDIHGIMNEMDLSRKNDYFEMQPLVYLSVLDDVLGPSGKKEFMLFYALDNEAESVDPEYEIMKSTRTVILTDMRRADLIRNGMLWDKLTETKTRKEVIDDIRDDLENALFEAGVENAEKWSENEELYEKILSLQSKRTDKAKDAIRRAIKEAGEFISACFVEQYGKIFVSRDSIEKFKEYAEKIRSKITEQQFPCKPRKNCEKCGFTHMCTEGGVNDEAE